MTSRRSTALVAVIVGVAAGAVSLARIMVANPQALSTLVWAEDGLFPLCVKVHGLFACTVDQYAGYLPVLPRMLAWPVSWFPIDSWASVTNIAAAIVASVVAAAMFLALRARGTGRAASIVVAVLPTIIPIAGFEAINSIASVYMLLLYVAAIMLAFPASSTPSWVYAVLLLVTALTVPSSVVLLLPLLLQGLRRRIPWRGVLLAGGGLIAGLAAQAVAAKTAAAPRVIEVSGSTLEQWASSIPRALLTLLPNQTELAFNGSLLADPLDGLAWLGPLVVGAILAMGVTFVILRGDAVNGIGLLLLTGLAAGAIPSLIGFSNHRYVVIPLLLWAAALVLLLDSRVPYREWAVGALSIAVVVAWLPGLPATVLRTYAAPKWDDMLAQAKADCRDYPESDVLLQFTPLWPYEDAKFPGVTSNRVPCSALLK